ncbi:MAG: hypothetical protein ACOYJC_00490 [Christensenellales bacterium]|jgi:hypothetical protein
MKQISVFIENTTGAIADFCTLLGDNGIDLLALSLADTANFGMVRAIVSDKEKALALLHEFGYAATLTDVMGVVVPDAPGGLARILNLLRQGQVSIEYLYSMVRHIDHKAVVIFRVDKPKEAIRIFEENDVGLLDL